MKMLDILREIVVDSSIYYSDELPEALDFNQIQWRIEHEFFIENQYQIIIEIADEYFQFSEAEDNADFLDVIQVKPNAVTKIEYIEII